MNFFSSTKPLASVPLSFKWTRSLGHLSAPMVLNSAVRILWCFLMSHLIPTSRLTALHEVIALTARSWVTPVMDFKRFARIYLSKPFQTRSSKRGLRFSSQGRLMRPLDIPSLFLVLITTAHCVFNISSSLNNVTSTVPGEAQFCYQFAIEFHLINGFVCIHPLLRGVATLGRR